MVSERPDGSWVYDETLDPADLEWLPTEHSPIVPDLGGFTTQTALDQYPTTTVE